MECWQEEWELKQADFLRYIQTMKFLADAWVDTGEKCDRGSGYTAMAKKTSTMFEKFWKDGCTLLIAAGYRHLLTMPEGMILADQVMADHLDVDSALAHVESSHTLPPPRFNNDNENEEKVD